MMKIQPPIKKDTTMNETLDTILKENEEQLREYNKKINDELTATMRKLVERCFSLKLGDDYDKNFKYNVVMAQWFSGAERFGTVSLQKCWRDYMLEIKDNNEDYVFQFFFKNLKEVVKQYVGTESAVLSQIRVLKTAGLKHQMKSIQFQINDGR